MLGRFPYLWCLIVTAPPGSCLPGWEVFERSCYYFNTGDRDTVVWEDAKNICESVNAEMVVLDTDAEDTFFRTHMPEGDTLWIGLYSEYITRQT